VEGIGGSRVTPLSKMGKDRIARSFPFLFRLSARGLPPVPLSQRNRRPATVHLDDQLRAGLESASVAPVISVHFAGLKE
jgi:hypothetical protein